MFCCPVNGYVYVWTCVSMFVCVQFSKDQRRHKLKYFNYLKSDIYNYPLKIITNKPNVRVFFLLAMSLCILVGIKGRKQLPKVHGKYSSPKANLRIYRYELFIFVFSSLQYGYPIPQPKNVSFTYQSSVS